MNEIDQIKKLAEASRHEPPPRIDVAGPVLGAIAHQRGTWLYPRKAGADSSLNRTLCIFAVAAMLAAAVTLSLAWQDWSSCLDPLQGLFGSFSMVMR